jgi:hypothetical protein
LTRTTDSGIFSSATALFARKTPPEGGVGQQIKSAKPSESFSTSPAPAPLTKGHKLILEPNMILIGSPFAVKRKMLRLRAAQQRREPLWQQAHSMNMQR